MREKFFHSLYSSLEWRVYAFFITNIFFWFTTHSFWKATGLALLLQIILFLFYTLWHFVRVEHGLGSIHTKDKSHTGVV